MIDFLSPEQLAKAGIYHTTGFLRNPSGYTHTERYYWHYGRRISYAEAERIYCEYLNPQPAWSASFPADPVIEANMRRLGERAAEGMKTYGVSMEDHNDKDQTYWIDHAIEEALDLANYLEKLKRILKGAAK